MAKNNVSSRLAELRKAWRSAEPRIFGTPLPDGEYCGKIVGFVVGQSKKGRLQLEWTLKVTSGKKKGREVRRYSGLETQENLEFLQGDLKTLELTIPDNPDDLPDLADEAIGLGVRFQVRTSVSDETKFTNIDFIERLDKSDAGGDEDADDDDDDAPDKDEVDDEPDEDENADDEEEEEEEDEDKSPPKKVKKGKHRS